MSDRPYPTADPDISAARLAIAAKHGEQIARMYLQMAELAWAFDHDEFVRPAAFDDIVIDYEDGVAYELEEDDDGDDNKGDNNTLAELFDALAESLSAEVEEMTRRYLASYGKA